MTEMFKCVNNKFLTHEFQHRYTF